MYRNSDNLSDKLSDNLSDNLSGRQLLRSLLPALCLALAALLLTVNRGYAQEPAPAVDPAAATGTEIKNNITQNTTWTKTGSPYNVTDLVSVEAGITLTIEPGVRVVVGRASDPQWSFPLSIKGTLIAQGTAADPITFTGLRAEAGGWAGLEVTNTETDPAHVTLDHVIVEYGGNTNFGDAATLELHSAVADINNSTFRNSKNYGVSVDYATQINLRNSNFTGNGVGAVINYFSKPKFDMTLSNLTASGNGVYNAVVYQSVTIDKLHRLEKMGLPYVFEDGFEVEPTGKLVLDPGIEVHVDSGFYVDGDLTAVGTAAEPILITGVKQEPAGWSGISISGGGLGIPNVTFDHVTIEYGGSDTEDWGGNLDVSSANVTVTNSILRNSGSHGIFNDGGAPDETFAVKVSNTTITGNRLAAVICTDESCKYDLNSLTVSGNGTDGIVYRAFVNSSGTWRSIGLPYIVEGQGGVGEDGTLTIEPGVEVRMASEASFSVIGVLSAVGTADKPIVFTGTQQQPGSWEGIQIRNGGTADLRYCDIGYGGNWGPVENSAQLSIQSSTLVVSNCRIHDSSSGGIMVVSGAKPTIRNNNIENNKVGLIAVFPLEQVDARFNWWGHASGPKHEDNPGGQGQEIIGNVAFEPWLTSPDDTNSGPQGITVDLNGPGRFAPGETVVYSIYYYNGTGGPIENAVLRFGMPANATLLETSPGGVFHALRNHVFWNLGNLPHNGQGLLWVRVQFDWGLADGLKAPTAAQLSGTNLPAPLFDVNDYLTYAPRILSSVTDLAVGDVDALRAANPSLDTLYQQATGDGFQYAHAERQVYSTGQEAIEIDLLRFDAQQTMSMFSIYWSNGNVVGTLVDGSSYTVVRAGQAVRYDQQSNAWAPTTLGMLQTAEAHDGITWGECVQNCIEEKLPGYLIKKKIKTLSDASKAISCLSAAQGDENAYLGCAKIVGKVAKQLSPVSEGIDLGQCNGECQQCEESGGDCDNPNCHCCTEDKYRCDSGDWLYGSFGIDVVKVKRCNLDEEDGRGTYFAEEVIKVCALCEQCMLGGAGAPVCVAKLSNVQAVNTVATLVTLAAIQGAQDRLETAASSDGECDECRQAKDPNEMYGPAGDLLPGQLVTYEIAYENVGEGEAFDVFVANKLDVSVFDPATLQINNGGSYSAGAQSIFWQVGTLAPKGQPGSQGKVSYSVRLRADLPSGTAIANQAVVHFPSVPEETPTNRLINVIKPLVADPQSLETEAGQPVAFTLSGKDAAGAPVSFVILDEPLYGILSGAVPNLTYTPHAGASGLDHVRFAASNGTSTSTPADITIRILPASSDVTGPAVKWTAPANGENVDLAVLLAGEDGTGRYYYPAVQAQFNEAVDGATVNSQTVIVTDAVGRQLAAEVRYDGASDQMQLLLREEPKVGQAYAVTITSGVKDLRGNAMSAAYSWSFRLASLGQPAEQPKVFLPVVAR